MIFEPKISLSLLVLGASMLSTQECVKNPKASYNEHKVLVKYTSNGEKKKEYLNFKTRKQKLISQNMNMCVEAYEHMLETPTTKFLMGKPVTPKMLKKWKTMSIHERLKEHFDLIASDLHAVDYSYEILGD